MTAVDFTGLRIQCQKHPDCQRAAQLFQEEIRLRTGDTPDLAGWGTAESGPMVAFTLCGTHCIAHCGAHLPPDKDSFRLERSGNRLTISAQGRRGLIYGFGLFLRKTEYHAGRILLVREIAGAHIPHMKIRGHQTGYRATPNTYGTWGPAEFERCYRDLMLFGANTCEVIPKDEADVCPLMRYDADDMAAACSEIADELDLDVSIWYPFDAAQTREEMRAARGAFFARMKRVNIVFPPGGDPGELPAREFVERCVLLKKELRKWHPAAQVWPSAQAPHSQPEWGAEFLSAVEMHQDQLDGVIYGPNHALPLEALRRGLPKRLPLRFYPDITHNLRCEYPVHYWADDWHYAFANTISREGVNPRPLEFARLHRETRPYVVGSVSYSEGVHDDVNKMLWSALDFCPDEPVEEILLDYARAFLWEASAEDVLRGILVLERNWGGDPAEHPEIEEALSLWLSMAAKTPALMQNWRFLLLLFRAECDALIRRRLLFGRGLAERAKELLRAGEVNAAKAVLQTEPESSYLALHADIWKHAELLFHLIGIRLDVARYGAKSWERGATLETVDQPVTDRLWLLNRLERLDGMEDAAREARISALLSRETVGEGELHFSFAQDGLEGLHAPQEGEWYMDVQGDRPNVNYGSLPMALTKVFDHYSLRAQFSGFRPGTDYMLRVAYHERNAPAQARLVITANGQTIYDGPPYGGEPDPDFDEWLLAPGFFSRLYPLPAQCMQDGALELLLREETRGIETAELWVVKALKLNCCCAVCGPVVK